ncbi:hypothetical protein [Arsenicibacter rosenii]|uniref:DUF4153 domain-containing protein n=1 Tax=Arsenicibacter rosenii TaxID=1750698 RepID=A0A1S2VDL8_9BACT|nr:hypothetical protein [Arsenicibacter rosenii]OIN56306.1 hypothetical protein BLX24_25695 [Arsenicibacter rosenii]
MRDAILSNLENPKQLEKLYRDDKPAFKTTFNDLYPTLQTNLLVQGWYQRLNYSQDDALWGTPAERLFVVVAALLAALSTKLPDMFGFSKEFFFIRNIGFIVFPVLIAFFGWKNKIRWQTGVALAVLMLIAALYINLLPEAETEADTLVLACLHLPLWLWSLLGFTFGGATLKKANWLGFLRYNGELAVMTAVLLISGGLTTAITINLFRLIGWNIEDFYFNYVVACGLAAVPIVGTFLTRAQPTLVNKVSPVIAKLFSPVALVMLVIYLVATFMAKKDPYHDREFLLLFNALLIGVMALIFFSVAETNKSSHNRLQVLVLFLLSLVTLVINGIALSAVLFRISEWGITPNRAAVLGGNVLMLSHLIYVGYRLFGALTRRSDLALVGQSMTYFMPLYSFWSAFVTFVFPVLFGFK